MQKKWTREYEYEDLPRFCEEDHMVEAMKELLSDIADGSLIPEGTVRVTIEIIGKETKDE